MFRIRWGNSQDQAVSFLSAGEEVEALQTLRIFGTKHWGRFMLDSVGFSWVRLGSVAYLGGAKGCASKVYFSLLGAPNESEWKQISRTEGLQWGMPRIRPKPHFRFVKRSIRVNQKHYI